MHTRLGFRCLLVLVLALLGAGVCSAQRPAARPPTTPTTPAVAPEVLTALEQMGAFLRTLKTFTLHADITTDEVLADTGQKIQFGSTVDFHVRAPDRLQADVTSDRKQRQFFYDGTTLTLYGQRVKFYAAVTAAATVTAAVVGSMVSSLPPSCSAVMINGFTYQNCSGTWYQPQYAGS